MRKTTGACPTHAPETGTDMPGKERFRARPSLGVPRNRWPFREIVRFVSGQQPKPQICSVFGVTYCVLAKDEDGTSLAARRQARIFRLLQSGGKAAFALLRGRIGSAVQCRRKQRRIMMPHPRQQHERRRRADDGPEHVHHPLEPERPPVGLRGDRGRQGCLCAYATHARCSWRVQH